MIPRIRFDGPPTIAAEAEDEWTDLPPPIDAAGPVVQQGRQANRQLARQHYENFLVTGFWLPRNVSVSMADVYGFCRRADDAADESGSPEAAIVKLDAFKRDLRNSWQGSFASPWWAALVDTARRHGITRRPLEELLDAFTQDQTHARYESFEPLIGYCRRSANPVGHLVLRIAGVDTTERRVAADQICTGLQLVNFWQDIRRDAAIGRIYVPRSVLDKFGLSEADMQRSDASAAMRDMVRVLREQTEPFFAEGLSLTQTGIPKWLARSVRLFAAGGMATSKAIESVEHDVWRRRPKVSKATQLRLVMRELFRL